MADDPTVHVLSLDDVDALSPTPEVAEYVKGLVAEGPIWRATVSWVTHPDPAHNGYLWIVSTPKQRQGLVTLGVPYGMIWTQFEVRDLLSATNPSLTSWNEIFRALQSEPWIENTGKRVPRKA